MYKGRIITIEGPDATGKKTQTKLLIQKLTELGHAVKTMSFPRYETQTGQKVRAYLNGEFGTLDRVDPKFAARLYADDRLAAKPELEAWLVEGGIWVFDRYVESNLAHQGAKFKDASERKAMIDWMTDLELNQLKLPPSDLVIYLSLPLDYLLRALETDDTRKGVKDLHERDKEHLIAAQGTYDMLSQQPNWRTIDCVPPHGKERYSIERIHEKVLTAVLDFLKKQQKGAGK